MSTKKIEIDKEQWKDLEILNKLLMLNITNWFIVISLKNDKGVRKGFIHVNELLFGGEDSLQEFGVSPNTKYRDDDDMHWFRVKDVLSISHDLTISR